MKIALLGLPQSGKKTFFSLLTGRGRGVAGFPALKPGEVLEGVAPIYDDRVTALATIFQPQRTKFADNLIALCPDIVPGATQREWLEAARRCDLLCLVLRDFSNDAVYHPDGTVDAGRDRQTLEAELLLADLELIERRLERLAKEQRIGQTAQQAKEVEVLTHLKNALESDLQFSTQTLSAAELETLHGLNLFTLKPALWARNVDEENAAGTAGTGSGEFSVSCLIEQEIMDLEPAERGAYLKELGLTASGLDRLNQAAYDALGLMSFYTVGKDEVRAWTIRKGTAAPAAAGKVHSDIERGFIRVEIIKYADLLEAGSEAEAKARGKALLKGRDYVIEDGDICHFRFNV